MASKVNSFLHLTKPRAMSLVLASGATGLVLEGSLISEPRRFVLFLLGLYLTGGSANALNEVLERKLDACMSRTRRRRPLPLHRLGVAEATGFSVVSGVVGVILLGLVFNWLTAALALGTLLFYSLAYTLWLKPTTSQNIVIGGIAGAMAPVGAWTAATGHAAATAPWLVFLLIFFWTPPHFWSLALIYRDDYRRVKLPMLPVTVGTARTLDRIFHYSLAMVTASLLPLLAGFGGLYAAVAITLGGLFVWRTWQARRLKKAEQFRQIFDLSPPYLFCILTAMALDGLL